MTEHTLLDRDGQHQYYLAPEGDDKSFQLLYFTHKGERAQWFNGRLNIDYTVRATKAANGVVYETPRKAPVYWFVSPGLVCRSERLKFLEIYNCPITAIESKEPNFIALTGTYSIGDAKSHSRETWAAMVELWKPENFNIRLNEIKFDKSSVDFSLELHKQATFVIELRSWFYNQKRKIVTPKNKTYEPKIFASIGKESTDITLLTETEIYSLFFVRDVNQYYDRFSNDLPARDIWIFRGKPYKTMDGDPQEQHETTTEKVVQILLDVYRLRVNLVTDESEVWSRSDNEFIPLDEKMLRAIKIRLNDEFDLKVSKDTLQEIVFSNWSELLHNKRYNRPTFHPYKDYFGNLPKWNGNDNIKEIFNALTIDKIQVSTREILPDSLAQLKDIIPGAIGDTAIDWQIASLHYFKKWFVGIVVQALTNRDQNALMPILCGGQNKGKSTYIQYLLPPELNNYYVQGGVVPSVSNYETAVNMRSNVLINFDDEPDGWDKKMWKSLKTIITLPNITYRAKYDKQPATHKRTSSFIATTNHPDILNDPSGTRRFLMLPVLDIARNFWEKIDIDQVWAQAAHFALTEKMRINLNKAEMELLIAANNVFFEESTEEQLIYELLSPITVNDAAEEQRNPEAFRAYDQLLPTTNGNIYLMRELDITTFLQSHANGQKLTTGAIRASLQKLGFKATHVYKQRTFKETKNQRCYAVRIGAPPTPPAAAEIKVLNKQMDIEDETPL